MASVSVDLGFGERAIISRRSVSGAPTAMHVRDAEEFLRRRPRARSVEEARRYLQQLALHAGYNPPGVTGSDTIAVFRAAVRSGEVTVVIKRAATRPGGGSSAAQSTARPGTASGLPDSRSRRWPRLQVVLRRLAMEPPLRGPTAGCRATMTLARTI
jgi:hypothetical protein